MKIYKQDDPSLANEGRHDCPIACLRCVLDHFGKEVSRGDLLSEFPVEFKKGTWEEGALSFPDLIPTLERIGDRFGFLVGGKSDFADLDVEFASCGPTDLLWIVMAKKDSEHVVVLRHLEDDGRINIMDPKYDDFVTVDRDAIANREPTVIKLSKR